MCMKPSSAKLCRPPAATGVMLGAKETPTIVLRGGHVGQDEEGEVLEEVEQQVAVAQAQVAGVRAGAALVVVPVGHGHKEAGSRMEADAEAPDVALGCLSPDRSTDGGEVVWDLEGTPWLVRRGEGSDSCCIYSSPRH